MYFQTEWHLRQFAANGPKVKDMLKTALHVEETDPLQKHGNVKGGGVQ